jgi:hypothetical protein
MAVRMILDIAGWMGYYIKALMICHNDGPDTL